MNIVGYVKKYGGESFRERHLGEADSLVFSELSYLDFSGCLDLSPPERTLRELALSHADALVRGTLFPKKNKRLLDAVAKSRRFGRVRAGRFREYNSEEEEVRFAAVTFRTDAGAYLAFRGTDITLLGWKEDFNMSFLGSIPSQKLAQEYLCETAEKTRGRLTVGGHSKGGNLALYAAMHAPREVQTRLDAVYDHDGPGFREEVFAQKSYRRIAKIVQKTVPHDSLIGVLFCSGGGEKVVRSRSVLLGQHDPFQWTVKGTQFEEMKSRTATSQRADLALGKWIAGMDDAAREKFVNAFYRVVKGSGAETVKGLLRGTALLGMKRAYDALPDDERALLSGEGKTLLTLWLHARK